MMKDRLQIRGACTRSSFQPIPQIKSEVHTAVGEQSTLEQSGEAVSRFGQAPLGNRLETKSEPGASPDPYGKLS
ncbi:hypothetical protein BV25DRAFT_1825542, partial [Artomyces pyxidatus]